MVMVMRRNFLRSSASLGLTAWAGTFLPRSAIAQTAGGGVASWSGVTDPGLLQKVWAIRFSNTLPWALDRTNAVLATALNVDAAGNVPVLGVKLAPNLPQIGFVMKPDVGTTNLFSIKAGQTPWPMLGPLGSKFIDGSPVPVTTLWGYGNHELENIFVDPNTGAPVPGLGVTFPARTFIVQRGAAIKVNWYNNLVDAAGNELPHLVGVDQTISMQADSAGAVIKGVPIAVHHHGGNSGAEFDGGPDQWFTPLKKQIGPGITSVNSTAGTNYLSYSYTNTEEAAMHWYHDHGEGVTRINAYAGLAGLFVIRDANETKLITERLLPTGEQEVPIVIQDKVFQANGSLAYTGDIPAFNGWNNVTPGLTKKLDSFYPIPVDPVTGLPIIDPATGNPALGADGFYQPAGPVGTYDPNDPAAVVAGKQPTHVPEMFGDVICVNGVAWPNFKVERRQYRLRLLNGSDSRVYNLRFGGLRFSQVATDLGMLNLPVQLTAINIFPGERKDIVIDFAQAAANTKIVVTNDAPFPYPTGQATLATDPWGTIMQIDVSKPLNETVNRRTKLTSETVLRDRMPGTPLLPIILKAPTNVVVRQIMLGEGCDEYGRIMPLLGTVAEGTKSFHDGPDISPKLGATEVWEFWNSTIDSHPIHMHLVRFRVVNRQAFTGVIAAKPMSNGWTGVSFNGAPVLSGLAAPAPATEQGWKDTVVCPPGQVTRIVAKFDKPGSYVYHCHILGHEEHDMMRWFKVL
jgi:spore coat protein A